jgi:hypothetical protein
MHKVGKGECRAVGREHGLGQLADSTIETWVLAYACQAAPCEPACAPALPAVLLVPAFVLPAVLDRAITFVGIPGCTSAAPAWIAPVVWACPTAPICAQGWARAGRGLPSTSNPLSATAGPPHVGGPGS